MPETQPAAVRLVLSSADNFRDLAGPAPGYSTRTGRMRTGMFFRSSQLDRLTGQDMAVLTAAGIAAIRDLREPEEVEDEPDMEVPGATRTHYEFYGVSFDGFSRTAGPADMRGRMLRSYRDFVATEPNQRAVGRLLRYMADHDRPEVFHCGSGKDRTGWIAAILHRIAGIDEEALYDDFLRSNELDVVNRARNLSYISEYYGAECVTAMEPALSVTREFLQASFDEVDTRYGGLERYLTGTLGLSVEQFDQLRRRLTT